MELFKVQVRLDAPYNKAIARVRRSPVSGRLMVEVEAYAPGCEAPPRIEFGPLGVVGIHRYAGLRGALLTQCPEELYPEMDTLLNPELHPRLSLVREAA